MDQLELFDVPQDETEGGDIDSETLEEAIARLRRPLPCLQCLHYCQWDEERALRFHQFIDGMIREGRYAEIAAEPQPTVNHRLAYTMFHQSEKEN